MLKIEDVKVGDELVCIDLGSFEGSRKCNFYVSPLFIVSRVCEFDVFFDNNKSHINSQELKYFKKKEQSQYTFDDLVNVSFQAKKDGVVCEVIWNDFLSVSGISLENQIVVASDQVSSDFICDAIKAIKALYKETFTIKSEEDLKRVKSNPKITLNNGEVVPFAFKETAKDHLIFYDQACGHNLIHFVFLKGATVEQEIGDR